MLADWNVTVDTATSTGTTTLKSDVTGKGPGSTAGTVTIGTAVTAATTVVRFNPTSYATTSTEINSYTAKITGGTDVKAWVFATGVNKPYDTSTSASLAFIGTPTDAGAITLDPGTASFSSPAVATSVPVTYSGYSISGAASPKFALFSTSGSTTANITAVSGGGGSSNNPPASGGGTASTTPVSVVAVANSANEVAKPVIVVATPSDAVVVATPVEVGGASVVVPIYSSALLNSESGGWGSSGLISTQVSGSENQLSKEESGQNSVLSSDLSGTVRVIGLTGGTAALILVTQAPVPEQMTSLSPVPAPEGLPGAPGARGTQVLPGSQVVPSAPGLSRYPQRARRQNRN